MIESIETSKTIRVNSNCMKFIENFMNFIKFYTADPIDIFFRNFSLYFFILFRIRFDSLNNKGAEQ